MGAGSSSRAKTREQLEGIQHELPSFTLEQLEGLRRTFDKTSRKGGSLTLEQFNTVMNTVVEDSVVKANWTVAFKKFDKDGNGRVDFREWLTGLVSLCSDSFENRIKFLFELWDEDGDGMVTSREVSKVLGMSAASPGVGEVLRRMDKDGNGHIDYAEFEATILPILLSEAQAAALRAAPTCLGAVVAGHVADSILNVPGLPTEPADQPRRSKADLHAFRASRAELAREILSHPENPVHDAAGGKHRLKADPPPARADAAEGAPDRRRRGSRAGPRQSDDSGDGKPEAQTAGDSVTATKGSVHSSTPPRKRSRKRRRAEPSSPARGPVAPPPPSSPPARAKGRKGGVDNDNERRRASESKGATVHDGAAPANSKEHEGLNPTMTRARSLADGFGKGAESANESLPRARSMLVGIDRRSKQAVAADEGAPASNRPAAEGATIPRARSEADGVKVSLSDFG